MKSLYLTLLIGFSLLVTAQNKISGIISDKDNKLLANVIVSIPEIYKETITDSDGKYSLINLPNGSFKIVFSSVGYATKLFSIRISEKENTQNISLQDNVIHMDEVIVSTAFNKLQSQNVMKVEHASVKTLKENGAVSLIDGIATIPGVSQISTGNAIGKPVIRGLSRQIRRMCLALGYNVTTLKRVRIMNITLANLPIGKWRNFTEAEIRTMDQLVADSSKTADQSNYSTTDMQE